ncbi:hypothetical protein ACFQ6O_30095 [Streptomyces sp. NPDC056441]|uniref:hypothetical protein n=1 Tax=Streptomyces sp. NPDC056441 TaxID=3345817 RepID=UPI0036CA39B1
MLALKLPHRHAAAMVTPDRRVQLGLRHLRHDQQPRGQQTGLREHGLALVDTVIAFHQAEVADRADRQVEVAAKAYAKIGRQMKLYR